MPEEISRNVVVCNRQGLHARPADLLVRMASQFSSEVFVQRGGERVDCTSILSLLTLGAADGTELTLIARGEDAETAVDTIEQFFLRGFDEPAEELGTSPVGETDPSSSP
ncbi:MAG: HPr family phosphocarrier protein [Planctomycetota bacterium]